MRLEGRVAIVTGAASGIGRACTELFADEGAHVLAVDLQGRDLADTHRDRPHIVPLEQDIAAKDAPETIVDTAISRFDRLDILMNNAGIATNALAEEIAL